MIDIDILTLDIQCPLCHFSNTVALKQIRLRNVVICRGCKANIKLNEPFGYLAIYRTTDRDLRFSLQLSTSIPMVVHNHKTIFLVTIDICPYDKPVSQRGPLQAVEITEEELIGILSESAPAQAK